MLVLLDIGREHALAVAPLGLVDDLAVLMRTVAVVKKQRQCRSCRPKPRPQQEEDTASVTFDDDKPRPTTKASCSLVEPCCVFQNMQSDDVVQWSGGVSKTYPVGALCVEPWWAASQLQAGVGHLWIVGQMGSAGRR